MYGECIDAAIIFDFSDLERSMSGHWDFEVFFCRKEAEFGYPEWPQKVKVKVTHILSAYMS